VYGGTSGGEPRAWVTRGFTEQVVRNADSQGCRGCVPREYLKPSRFAAPSIKPECQFHDSVLSTGYGHQVTGTPCSPSTKPAFHASRSIVSFSSAIVVNSISARIRRVRGIPPGSDGPPDTDFTRQESARACRLLYSGHGYAPHACAWRVSQNHRARVSFCSTIYSRRSPERNVPRCLVGVGFHSAADR
jgi:hypothetical protein